MCSKSRLSHLLQRDEGLQLRIHVHLLLDAGELDELLGELVGVERVERILILELGGQQRQEGLEVPGDRALIDPGSARRRR